MGRGDSGCSPPSRCGLRLLARFERDSVLVFNRGGHDCTAHREAAALPFVTFDLM